MFALIVYGHESTAHLRIKGPIIMLFIMAAGFTFSSVAWDRVVVTRGRWEWGCDPDVIRLNPTNLWQTFNIVVLVLMVPGITSSALLYKVPAHISKNWRHLTLALFIGCVYYYLFVIRPK